MTVKEAIEQRRAYRSLEPVEISDAVVEDLARCAQLAPTCFNNQPARFVFVRDPGVLTELKTAFSPGNEWCYAGSMVIAVSTKRDMDCIIKDREYFLFDTGLQTALLILRVTELGLVAHPIAGYNQERVRKVLNIPQDFQVITLVIVGKHSQSISPVLSEKQVEAERIRPARLPLDKVMFYDRYKPAPSEG